MVDGIDDTYGQTIWKNLTWKVAIILLFFCWRWWSPQALICTPGLPEPLPWEGNDVFIGDAWRWLLSNVWGSKLGWPNFSRSGERPMYWQSGRWPNLFELTPEEFPWCWASCSLIVRFELMMSSGQVAKKRMTLNIPERAKTVLVKNVNLGCREFSFMW